MTDDLVNRLRGNPITRSWVLAAADRIEQLTDELAAARERAKEWKRASEYSSDCFKEVSAAHDAALAALKVAREALEPFRNPANPHTNGDYLRARDAIERIDAMMKG